MRRTENRFIFGNGYLRRVACQTQSRERICQTSLAPRNTPERVAARRMPEKTRLTLLKIQTAPLPETRVIIAPPWGWMGDESISAFVACQGLGCVLPAFSNVWATVCSSRDRELCSLVFGLLVVFEIRKEKRTDERAPVTDENWGGHSFQCCRAALKPWDRLLAVRCALCFPSG